jgi:hypothetical protein
MEIKKAIDILSQDICYIGHRFTRDEYDQAVQIAIAALEAQQANRWIPVTERMPEAEKEVEVTIERRMKNKTFRFTCRAFYEDGAMWTGDSAYDFSNYDDTEYDEEHEDYKIPEGWFEAVTYMEEFAVIDDFIVAWRPVSEPWREEKC